MDKLLTFLKQKGDTESKNIFAGTHQHSGVSLLHRQPTQSDGKLARLSYFLRFGSERNEARQQIKIFLEREGIELTADIRKALPSRFSNGNAEKLLEAIQKAHQSVIREINPDYTG